jgi:predicted Rossmann fold nucleotide-binding protein DprA/Smf involved in DNA uptake
MKNLKKSLQSVNKDLNALSKKIDKIIIAARQLETPKAVKKKPVKKVAVKKPAPKKTVKLTTADTMFGVIKKSKKGVNVDELMKKTEFDKKKIYNIIYKLTKQGKIKSVEKGVYIKA